jgi:hypothetical protein
MMEPACDVDRIQSILGKMPHVDLAGISSVTVAGFAQFNVLIVKIDKTIGFQRLTIIGVKLCLVL